MPEGPEVEVVRASLAKQIINETIVKVTLSNKKLRRPVQKKDFKFLLGQSIKKVSRRGKFLYIMTNTTQGFWCRLGMSGKLLLWSPRDKSRPHTHVVLHLKNGKRLAYVDPRRFGEFFPFAEHAILENELKRLGPDPLSWTSLEQKNIIQARLKTKRQIKVFLLDQNVISGVGNIYACEALYHAKISPFRQTRNLSTTEMARLLLATEMVLHEAVKNGGTSFSDYEMPDGQKGQNYQKRHVFQREGEPCPACSADIKMRTQHGRSTFYCPRCQKTR